MKTTHKLYEVKLEATKDELHVIHKIGKRAAELAASRGDEYPLLDACMDVTAVHLNGNPLDLDKLLFADDFNFIHDMAGIYRHLDRTTGRLQHYFVPRCSKRDA